MNLVAPPGEMVSPPRSVAPAAEHPAARRFTRDGDDGLERHLGQACQRVLSGVRGLIPPAQLEAVLLGGGYGRGEGGVWQGAAGDRPYNDLEFYVFVRGNRHLNELRYRRALDALGEILTHLADVEIEFKITSLAELRSQPVSMFSYDLLAGHRSLDGEPLRLTGCAHHLDACGIPLAEATRLLMNRGTGLLLARARLAHGPLEPEDADFVRRNLAKAELACGDAVLTARGRYHWSCQERHRQLRRIAELDPLPWHDTVLRHHAAGVAFKLHPDPQAHARPALLARHAEITELTRQCWLWLEQRRLGRTFATVRAYAQDPVDKGPAGSVARNVALNLRVDGLRPHLRPRPWRHPRQRAFHALALLLWDAGAVADAATRAQLRRELRSRATSPAEFARDYETLWRRVQ
jgi:hypothetical protein